MRVLTFNRSFDSLQLEGRRETGAILAKELGKALLDSGIDTLYVRGVERPFLQRVALKLLLYYWGVEEGIYRGSVLGEEFGVKLISGRGYELATYRLSPRGRKIDFAYPEYPLFVVDMSLWNRHSEKEKRKLINQLGRVVSLLRDHLWDYNLSLNHANEEFKRSFLSSTFFNKVRFDVEPPLNSIVLDPYGEVLATEETLRTTDCFILGGIVDDSGWKYATRELAEKSGYPFKRVKIVLRGSRVGVPDRLNKIISIILRVREGQSLEEAILEEQSNADKFLRLLRDTTLNGDLEGNASWLRAGEKVKERVRKVISRTQPGSSSSPR